MIKRLLDITNQLLDLGKRNRLLNFKDTGLKTLKVLSKNSEEVFRGLTNNREFTVFNTDPVLSKYSSELKSNAEDDQLNYIDDKVYEICHPLLDNTEVLCYKRGYSMEKVLKSLSKEYKQSIIEKGINSLYMTFGFVHYIEEEEKFSAPLLLIPIELDNETGPFIISEYEDDVLLNPTLKYYFSSVYGIELPEYKQDALATYLNKVREVLTPGIELDNGMAIGIYSFHKMNMYNDLINNQEKVIQNANIRVLLGDKDALDDDIKPSPIFPVVNCDGSQLEAIQNAANGKSFCLQGPPGSGKSQTITNIIASLLGQGKKILFVSEKISALRVVFENLRRAGLSEFAIELHSNKTNKKEFIDNLYNTAVLPKYDIEFKSRFIGGQYDYLNYSLREYEEELRKPIPRLGITLLDLYSEYLKINVECLNTELFTEDLNIYDLKEIRELFDEYVNYSEMFTYDYKDSPLYTLSILDNTYLANNFDNELDASIRSIDILYDIKEEYNKCPQMNVSNTLETIDWLYLTEKLLRIKNFNPYLLFKKHRDRLKDCIEGYLNVNKFLTTDLFKTYNSGVINEDLETLNGIIRNGKDQIFKSKEYKEAFSKILSYRNQKENVNIILEELSKLIRIRQEITMASSYSTVISKMLGDISKLNLRDVLADIRILDNAKDILMTDDNYNSITNKFRDTLANFDQIKDDIANLIRFSQIFDNKRINFFKESVDECHKTIHKIDSLRKQVATHMIWAKVIKKLSDYHMLEFIDTFCANKRELHTLADTFEKEFYKHLIDSMINDSKVLKEFRAASKTDTIEDFINLDEKKLLVNRDNIIVLNSQKRPDESVLDGSMFKILSREHEKTRRHMPIRSLLEQTFELALDIKPVFLMSPLSVSTYLASEMNIFDCVIFDEASQIFASDALGSIYRAKQCIVIGDTKQMPPTNFFQAGVDDINTKEFDLESILDKASSQFDTLALKWHYRSRNEELITFSNQAFYDSNLIVIPQSKQHEEGFGIDFYHVDNGIYDAKTRTNHNEAQRVCDMVFEHVKTSKLSLGVVAFSNVQAELINELIEKRLKKYPEEEVYFPKDVDEPFFVKNLETVQGDERDRIIFSICYGYNTEGKFYQRFGPLNNVGGERRLNVAVTRAKFNVSIVSSIRYSDINSSTTNSLGVKLLQNYLEFAENIETNKNYLETDNGIINTVKEYIESLGYEVYPNYGSSSFKINLAVKKNDEYILAVMIDGSGGYSTNMTDKYRLERILLERQGWRYFKLYSTSWINDRENEKKRIYDVLNNEYEPHQEPQHKNRTFLREDTSDNTIEALFIEYLSVDQELGKNYYDTKGMEALVNQLVKREQPIHEDYLNKRVQTIIEEPKMTQQLREDIQASISDLITKKGDFYFFDPNMRIRLRYNGNREVIHIHPSEIYDGIITVVSRNNGITVDGCYKSIAQLLGFDKIIPNLRRALEEQAELLKFEAKIEERDGAFYRK